MGITKEQHYKGWLDQGSLIKKIYIYFLYNIYWKESTQDSDCPTKCIPKHLVHNMDLVNIRLIECLWARIVVHITNYVVGYITNYVVGYNKMAKRE